MLLGLDGTPNKARLGANAILGVSLAVAKAAAQASGLSLYRYVGGVNARVLPVPMMNIVNGGAHADNPIDFQEFADPARRRLLRRGPALGRGDLPHTLKSGLKSAGHNTNVGDEGGFAPNLASAEAALDFVMGAIEKAGFKPGDDVFIGLDCASTEFFKDGAYHYEGEGKVRGIEAQVKYLAGSSPAISIVTIEDGMAEDDWAGWKLLTDTIGSKCRATVGDDLFVTNVERLSRGIKDGVGNAILVKVNQIGSTSPRRWTRWKWPTRPAIALSCPTAPARPRTTIADLAVATNCGQIKTGSLARSDRTAKYNQAAAREQELGDSARYAGKAAIKSLA